MTDDFDDYLREDRKRRMDRMQHGWQKSGLREELHKKYKAAHPIEEAARQAVTTAVASGRLVKPDRCEGCRGVFDRLEGHHCDYAKPLEVIWYCYDCHREWHDNNEAINGDKPVGMMDIFEKFADKTFNDAAALYLSEFEGKCRTRQEYALKHIQPYIGHLPLIQVDDQALATYKAERRKVAMVGTINKEITTATAVMNKACRVWRWIPSAPKLLRVKGDTKKPYPLSWDEQINVFKRLVGVLQKIALFAVNTGVRREEIFKLKWEDERDIDGVMVFILRDTKNGQDRPVILNSIARRVVEQMRSFTTRSPITGEKGDPVYVFPRMTVNKVFNLAWNMAGLPDDKLVKKGIHNLRHTFGYRLRCEGVPGEDRDALLGHHSKSLTQHYAVPDIQRLAEMAERVTVRRATSMLR